MAHRAHRAPDFKAVGGARRQIWPQPAGAGVASCRFRTAKIEIPLTTAGTEGSHWTSRSTIVGTSQSGDRTMTRILDNVNNAITLSMRPHKSRGETPGLLRSPGRDSMLQCGLSDISVPSLGPDRMRRTGALALVILMTGCGGGGGGAGTGERLSPLTPSTTFKVEINLYGNPQFTFRFQNQTISAAGRYTFALTAGDYQASGETATALGIELGTGINDPNPPGGVQISSIKFSGPPPTNVGEGSRPLRPCEIGTFSNPGRDPAPFTLQFTVISGRNGIC